MYECMDDRWNGIDWLRCSVCRGDADSCACEEESIDEVSV